MNKILKILFPVLTVLCMAFILTNSMQTAVKAEKKQGIVVEVVEKVATKVAKKEVRLSKENTDSISKTAHVFEFALFSAFLTVSLFLFGKQLKGVYEKVLLCGMFLAITDEHLQLLAKGRGSKLTDVLVDLAGIMIGYVIARLIVKFTRRKKNARDGSVL